MPKYSDKYFDIDFEYRYVILPRNMADKIIEIRETGGYLSEDESRAIGIIQSKGWVHYDYHIPEPHILLFRRPIGTNPRTGKVEQDLKDQFMVSQHKKFMTMAN
jgi:cyclin-dependent kinase regulatory subunit CKS1